MTKHKKDRIRLAALFIATALIASAVIACGGAASNSNSANAKPATTNANAGNAANTTSSANTAAAPVGDPGSLATPSDAYRTAYEFRKNKDVQGLKKIMSDDIKEFLTMMGKDEKPKKDLDAMIAEMFDSPQADKADVRNEQIKGDRATVEYLTKEGDWKTMDFEKVDGKWLLGFPKADGPGDGKPANSNQ